MAYERPRHGRQLRAKCTRSSIAGLLIVCAMSTTARAQSGPEPLGLLNKVGRYMGIGYTRRGYHAPSRALPYQPIEYQPPTVHPAYGGAAPAHQLPYGAQPSRRSDCPDCGPPVGADYDDHTGPFDQQPSDGGDSDRLGQSQESSSPSSQGDRSDESTRQPTESLLDAPLDDESGTSNSNLLDAELLEDDSLLPDNPDAADDDLLLFHNDFSDRRTTQDDLAWHDRQGHGQRSDELNDLPTVANGSGSFDVLGSHGSEASRDATRMKLGRPVAVTPTRKPRMQAESLDRAFGPYYYPRDRDPLLMRRVGVTVNPQHATSDAVGHQDRSAQATSALPR